MKGKMIPSIPEKYRKRIEELTLADDIGFMQGFDGSIEGTEHLVRTLTGRDGITVISVQAQKHLSSIDRHSVILDIYAEGRNGEQIDIGSEETLFEIVYANDTVLVAHLLSDLRKLKIYNQRHPGDSYEFLHIGRGPFEVNQCAVKSRDDTLYAMSYAPVGIQGVITIPVCRTDDKSAWRYEDISEAADVPMGGDFDVLQGQYIVLGDKYGQPNILSSITRGADDVSVTPLSWWPQDKYKGSIISKQALYMNASKIFASGSKIVYACSEGRYVSILDFSSGTPAEKLIYGEFPVYKAAPDGMNAIRSPKSRRGVYAFATDSLIYISPLPSVLQ